MRNSSPISSTSTSPLCPYTSIFRSFLVTFRHDSSVSLTRELSAFALVPLRQPPVKCLWSEVLPLLRRLRPPAFPYHRPASRHPTRAPALLHRDQRIAQSSLRPS